jgi:hypothetical protein
MASPRREASVRQLALQQADDGPHRVAFGPGVVGEGRVGEAATSPLFEPLHKLGEGDQFVGRHVEFPFLGYAKAELQPDSWYGLVRS